MSELPFLFHFKIPSAGQRCAAECSMDAQGLPPFTMFRKALSIVESCSWLAHGLFINGVRNIIGLSATTNLPVLDASRKHDVFTIY